MGVLKYDLLKNSVDVKKTREKDWFMCILLIMKLTNILQIFLMHINGCKHCFAFDVNNQINLIWFTTDSFVYLHNTHNKIFS